MNSLSWFLYLADALSSIKIATIIFGVGCAGFGFIGWVAWSVCKGSYADALAYAEPGNRALAKEKAWIDVWNPFRKFLPAGFALVLVGCLLPSSGTMYAIAASQVGEQIVKSETVQGIANDATKALQQWIKKQITTEGK